MNSQESTITNLSHVPQITESTVEHNARMQWFRDAKFGMFIHWGPCSIGQREIGWGRNARRPWDINIPDPSGDKYDVEYDNYYKQFNPVEFDADAWVRFAQESGMKYMVLITKHHDGFSMFDTKLSDYNIMHTPYGRDIVKQFVDACHRHDMKVGLYYSTRDWYHPDYLVGDNKKYDAWYRGQVEELLTNYGKIDMMWFDHVGGRDWGKWRFDELFEMMYRLQPHLLVNNRAARFCGPKSPEDRGPESAEIEKMTQGDFYTPEGSIGAMDIENDWESCIHVGQGWSYRGEEGFKGPEDCIKMLASCGTGGGNLLLNFGPRPDGTFAEGEAAVARAMGAWLGKYGQAVYGTRGGPYQNGNWGGSCHKNNKIFLLVYKWPEGEMILPALPRQVLEAQTFEGRPVDFIQSADRLTLQVANGDRDTPVTVIELTIDAALGQRTFIPAMSSVPNDLSQYGTIISQTATLDISSTCEFDHVEDHPLLFNGDVSAHGYAFCTGREERPWVKIDLGSVKTVKAVLIANRHNERSTNGLLLSVSVDGENWEKAWQADEWEPTWCAVPTHFHAGIQVPGRKARYLLMQTHGQKPRHLLLKHVTVYGE